MAGACICTIRFKELMKFESGTFVYKIVESTPILIHYLEIPTNIMKENIKIYRKRRIQVSISLL